MIIKELSCLKDEEINQIKELEQICKEHDKLRGNIGLDTSLNFNKKMNTTYLLYDGQRLISMLTMFVPTQQEAEVSAFTLPQYRQRGYFKRLLETAKEELKKYNVPNIIYVCENGSAAGKEVILKQEAAYSHSEYSLAFDMNKAELIKSYDCRLQLRRAEAKDTETLIGLSTAIFDESYESAKSIVESSLQAINRLQFIAEDNSSAVGVRVAVGLGAAVLTDDGSCIYGLGIAPEHQGKSYGKELLYLIIKKLLELGRARIEIEVGSENTRAFELYKKSGFMVENSYDYYKKAL